MLILGLAACASAPTPAPPLPRGEPAGPAPNYRLHVGDELEVKFFYSSELNETVQVRPDGRIALQLVGEIDAAGRTPAELRTLLVDLYKGPLRNPEIAVLVRSYTPPRIYVGGQVRQPGVVDLRGPLTALRAIMQVGGFLDSGERSSVVILRRGPTPQPEFLTLDLAGDLGGQASGDLWLQSDDIVFVPKTRIAYLNQLVDEYFDELIPASRSIGVQYNYGNGFD